jgi:hypothetical protein
VIGIPIARPPIPVVGAGEMDDGNLRSCVEIFDPNISYVNAVFALGHDMHLHPAAFHVSVCRDGNGFRGSPGTKNKRIAIQGVFPVFIHEVVPCSIGALDPESAGYLIVLRRVTILDRDLQVPGLAGGSKVIDSACQTGFICPRFIRPCN